MKDFVKNRFRSHYPTWDKSLTGEFESSDIIKVHRLLEEYSPTPLLHLPNLAESLGLRQILVKDEANRFGLKAFKALGASYAVYRFICNEFKKSNLAPPTPESFYSKNEIIQPEKYTFCTATDGNHGRGVAWTASKLKQKAVIYMPKNTVPARIENIRKTRAEVHVVDGDYDDAVSICQSEADKYGWQIISDTSWPGYETIPVWIMAGYVTIFQEIDQRLSDSKRIDCFIVQGGVGALAAAASWYYNTTHKAGDMKIISIESRLPRLFRGSPLSVSIDSRRQAASLGSIEIIFISPALWVVL
jgi:diaminopropionate ammonia-lyase